MLNAERLHQKDFPPPPEGMEVASEVLWYHYHRGEDLRELLAAFRGRRELSVDEVSGQVQCEAHPSTYYLDFLAEQGFIEQIGPDRYRGSMSELTERLMEGMDKAGELDLMR